MKWYNFLRNKRERERERENERKRKIGRQTNWQRGYMFANIQYQKNLKDPFNATKKVW